MPRDTRSVEERFMSKVAFAPTGCWEWLASHTRDGYAQFKVNGSMDKAHRVAYRLFVGEIPLGRELHHTCGVPGCVNPDHLEPVTRAEHARLGKQATQTHCIHGHPFDEANTYWRGQGRRGCRACNREAVRRYQARKAAA